MTTALSYPQRVSRLGVADIAPVSYNYVEQGQAFSAVKDIVRSELKLHLS